MTQPRGLGGGVAPPMQTPPPPAPQPQWPAFGPPTPPRRPRAGLIAAGIAVVAATAVVAGGAGALITAGRAAPGSAAPAPADSSPGAAEAALCDTLEAEYPKIVAAIDNRNLYSESEWTDPAKAAATDRLSDVAWTTASNIESSISRDLSSELERASKEYVAGLRALSISQQDRAPAKQLNGVAMFYNTAADRLLPLCGMEG